MALVPLRNSWQFQSNCFVCEPSNATGLAIPFFHDDEAAAVVADFTLDERFSGAPHYVHGGVALAVLDEAMAWGAIALGGSFALTVSTRARFVRPVRVGEPHRVEARLTRKTARGTFDLAAVLLDAGRKPCVRARSQFAPMNGAQAGDAIGDVGDDGAPFVRT
ncbi:MAG TPA: PaaI family thioesterase [Acidimicrobiales bacterium]|nr:PaaI family thioesterase [Acidimicrobiales bacterium]